MSMCHWGYSLLVETIIAACIIYVGPEILGDNMS
jgi:hypothetical protein